ncbi:hypothetical protein ACYX8G_17130 [Microbacterium saperdae]
MAQFVDGSCGLFDTKHPDRVDDLAQLQFEESENRGLRIVKGRPTARDATYG